LVGFVTIAVASMFIGNLLALLQRNVKRLLAYSSIAHLGYLLVTIVAVGEARVTAASFYLAAYFAAMLSTFGIVGLLSRPGQEAESLDDYRGLFWRRPWVAAALTIALLSLIGIPLTAGFFGKLGLLTAGVGSGLWLLVLSVVTSSAIGLYYYLRVIVTLFLEPSEEEQARQPAAGPTVPERIVFALLALVVLGVGVYPTPLLRAISSVVSGLTLGPP
jgi:NADH-quinone oxidoreductase subunit N